jgi:hypothetical protein
MSDCLCRGYADAPISETHGVASWWQGSDLGGDLKIVPVALLPPRKRTEASDSYSKKEKARAREGHAPSASASAW